MRSHSLKNSVDSNWVPRLVVTHFGAKLNNRVLEESVDDGLGVTVGQRDGFKPSSEAIHTGEEEKVAS